MLGLWTAFPISLAVMKRSADVAIVPGHFRNWKDVGHYRCPECDAHFNKWSGCNEHWRILHSNDKGILTAKDCRLRWLSAATSVDGEEMDVIKGDIANRMAATPSGQIQFPVSPGATAHDMALLWELVTSIDLHCVIQGDICIIQSNPFEKPKGSEEDEILFEELSPILDSHLAGMSAGRKKKKKKKKNSFYKKVSEVVTEVSLERTSQRAKARTQVRKQSTETFECWNSYLEISGAEPSGLSDCPRGARQMDNRPAWKIRGERESDPAVPITSGKGFDMLKRLGWTQDTGLGRKSQGIVVPIEPRSQLNKKGIGSS